MEVYNIKDTRNPHPLFANNTSKKYDVLKYTVFLSFFFRILCTAKVLSYLPEPSKRLLALLSMIQPWRPPCKDTIIYYRRPA
jgi:hypothetical protein